MICLSVSNLKKTMRILTEVEWNLELTRENF